ncbi:plasma kallikrein-like [Aplochiton taeniatus]
MGTLYSLLGLLYLCGLSLSQAPVCVRQLQVNVDFPGSDVTHVFSPDVEHCQLVCTQHHSCLFFTFVGPAFTDVRFKCHLKHSWTTVPRAPLVIPFKGVVSGFSQRVPVRTLNEASDSTCKTMIFPLRTHFTGGDFENMPAVSAEHCLFLCSAHPHCTHFSYTTTEWKTTDKSRLMRCYLKHNTRELRDVPTDGVISGIPTRLCQPNNDWKKKVYEGVDLRGSDMRFVLLDNPAACQKACTDDPQCQFYTYANETFENPTYRRRCYLKRVIAMPVPPKVATLANVVSGFSLKNC